MPSARGQIADVGCALADMGQVVPQFVRFVAVVWLMIKAKQRISIIVRDSTVKRLVAATTTQIRWAGWACSMGLQNGVESIEGSLQPY